MDVSTLNFKIYYWCQSPHCLLHQTQVLILMQWLPSVSSSYPNWCQRRMLYIQRIIKISTQNYNLKKYGIFLHFIGKTFWRRKTHKDLPPATTVQINVFSFKGIPTAHGGWNWVDSYKVAGKESSKRNFSWLEGITIRNASSVGELSW